MSIVCDQLITWTLDAKPLTKAPGGEYHYWVLNALPNYWHNGGLPGRASERVRGGYNWAVVTNSRQVPRKTRTWTP